MPFDFTQDAFRDFSDQVLKAEGDQATLTSLLADMQGTYTEQLALAAKQTQDMEKINAENERLKATNMELFLMVGANKQQTTQPQDPEPDKDMDTAAYMEKYFKEDK